MILRKWYPYGMNGKGKIIRQFEQRPGRRKIKVLHYKKLAPRTKPKGKEIEVVSPEEDPEEFHLSGGDGYETVDEEAGDTSG